MINVVCDLDCKYENNGFCTLDQVPTYITSYSEKCLHFIPRNKDKYNIYQKDNKVILK